MQKRRGLPRAMVSCSGTVACDPETVRAKDGSELLLVRVVGERQGEPERLAFWVEGRAAEVIRGSAGWKVGDLVQVKLLLVGRAGHEDLSDGCSNELMSKSVRYGNDVAQIREELQKELVERLGLSEWPSAPAGPGEAVEARLSPVPRGSFAPLLGVQAPAAGETRSGQAQATEEGVRRVEWASEYHPDNFS